MVSASIRRTMSPTWKGLGIVLHRELGFDVFDVLHVVVVAGVVTLASTLTGLEEVPLPDINERVHVLSPCDRW